MIGDRPNLLLVMADQHRADWIGTESGLPLRTPNLDALRSRGVQFDRAYCASPLCGPSRACLAGGMDYGRCGVPNHLYDYPLSQPTYYQRLRDAGYFVTGAGKFDLHKSSSDWGVDGSGLMAEWGFSSGIDNEGKRDAVRSGAVTPKGPYMAFLHERGLARAHTRDFESRRQYRDTFPTPLPDEAYCDNWIAENALQLLSAAPKDQPWHLIVNFAGPHEPMDVTESMLEGWQDVEFPFPVRGKGSDEDHQSIRRNYAAMIENLDRQLGRLLEVVAQRGELEKTVVVYASDHGEMLGDHGLWAKSVPHDASIRVPLIVAGPGVGSAIRSEAPVQLHDLAATFLELGHAEKLANADSRSLVETLKGATVWPRPAAVSALNDWRAVTDGRFKLIERLNGEDILFDVAADPAEATNLLDGEPDIATRLRSQFNPPPVNKEASR